MKTLFEKLQKLEYSIHNRRILCKPDYTSAETKQADLIQEFALVVMWLLEKYKIWICIYPTHTGDKWGYEISIYETLQYPGWFNEIKNYNFNSPQEAYSAAFDYILKELLI